ncbi:MAG: NAD(P) transhydrogenase subunit alpha [Cyanobacteria bacterium K_DeepCast_150m_m2_101]|nr:NAD(P) transhydrogenase subunit alpha [Cyanobacteria bacterium K_DeepCast_150m_m2_101]
MLVPRECRPGETRVAATPETVRRLSARGCLLHVEQGAGVASGFDDAAYGEAGAQLIDPAVAAAEHWSQADVVLAVQAGSIAQQRRELEALRPGSLLLGLLEPHGNDSLKQQLEQQRLSAMALELLPRISRAQTMDVLSSQANIAGYKAVLLASAALDRYVPMLMTAAGTIQPARALILGAGVAGLQALATARRLGAVAYVSDVRAAAKEQVESLGGRFIEPPELDQKPGETGGYAQQATEDFLAAQRRQLTEQLALADMVICTAQVPGRPAPRLIDDAMLQHMRPGSVVVDLAVAQGGNCEGTQPGATVLRHGVQLIGADQLPCSVANHASALYARNVAALLEHLLEASGSDPTALQLNLEDPIVSGCLFTHHAMAGAAA